MRVLKQELIKTFFRPSVFFVLIFLVFINICMLNLPSNDNRVSKDSYIKAFDMVKKVDASKRLSFVNKHLDHLYTYSGKDTLLISSNFVEELHIFEDLKSQLKQIESYPDYIKKISSDGDEEISIFKNRSTYSKKNQLATRKAYRDLTEVKPEFVKSEFIIKSSTSPSVDILNLLFIIYISISLVFYEKERGLFKLFSTMEYGRGILVGSKLVTLFIVVAFSSILFWASSFFISWLIYKPVNLMAPIQSVLGYDQAVLKVSILGYMFIYILSKILITYLIALIIMYISIKASDRITLFISISLIFIFSYIIRLFIHGDSNLSLFYYINIIPFLNVTPILRIFYNLNIMGYPVSIMSIFYTTTLILTIFFIFFIYINFASSRPIKRRKRLSLKKGNRRKIHANLFNHELYKLLIMNRGLLVILFLAICQFTLANNLQRPDLDEFYYRNYSEKLTGIWSEKQEAFIKKEKSRFEELDKLESKTNERYGNKEIGDREFAAVNQYIGENRKEKFAFDRIQNKVEELKLRPGENRSFVYETGYEKLFGKSYEGYSFELIQIAVYLSCLIFLFSNFMAEEYETRMINIIRTTSKGRGDLLKVKLFLGILFSSIMFIITFLPQIVAVNKIYPLNNLASKLSDISLKSNGLMSLEISIRTYMLIIYMTRFISSICLVLLSYLFAIKIKKATLTISILISVIVVPILLRFLGISWIDYISLNSFFSGNILFNSVNSLGGSLILVLVPIGLGTVSYIKIKKLWNR